MAASSRTRPARLWQLPAPAVLAVVVLAVVMLAAAACSRPAAVAAPRSLAQAVAAAARPAATGELSGPG